MRPEIVDGLKLREYTSLLETTAWHTGVEQQGGCQKRKKKKYGEVRAKLVKCFVAI